jgi:hypothetical protein
MAFPRTLEAALVCVFPSVFPASQQLSQYGDPLNKFSLYPAKGAKLIFTKRFGFLEWAFLLS